MATRALLLALWVASADGALTWTESTGTADGSLPVALRKIVVVVLDDTIYVIGGNDSDGARTDWSVDTVYYSTNPVANGWSTAENVLPAAVMSSGAAVLSSTIYVVGGWSGSALVGTAYSSADPDGAGWTTEIAMPDVLSDTVMVTFNSKIYAIGGAGSGNRPIDKVHYTSDAAIWAEGENLPSVTVYHAVVVFDSKIYVLGGNNGDATSVVYYSTDPSSVAWTTGTPLSARAQHVHTGVVVLHSAIYLIGGPVDYGANTVQSSTDGVTWTADTDSNANNMYYSVAAVLG
jgi:hypothetical protein